VLLGGFLDFDLTISRVGGWGEREVELLDTPDVGAKVAG
jgi:hypothetical protein